MATKFKPGDIVQVIKDYNSDGMEITNTPYVGFVFQIKGTCLDEFVGTIEDTKYEVCLLRQGDIFDEIYPRIFFDRDLTLIGESVCP
jgi:hypothetical protein